MSDKKYYQSSKLIDRIDWDTIIPMGRYAGGHDEQMQGLFKDVTVIGHWNEGDYQGQVATCVMLNDTKEYVIYNDWYGSCSGCDFWEDATDDDVRVECKTLASNSYIFKNLADVIEFLGNPKNKENYGWISTSTGLLNNITKKEISK